MITTTHTFTTDEEKDQLLHCFLFLNACQCSKRYWNDEVYGIERTAALRQVESEAYKTNWAVAAPAIKKDAPRVYALAEVGVPYFIEHYPSDPIYMAMPQVFAVVKMLDKMRKNPDAEKTNPILAKPPKTKKKK